MAKAPQYAVREPGEYTETLAQVLADDFECMEIWCRWNGYASYEVVSTDTLGWCTLLCTAKGALHGSTRLDLRHRPDHRLHLMAVKPTPIRRSESRPRRQVPPPPRKDDNEAG